jgi:hypothetical protein
MLVNILIVLAEDGGCMLVSMCLTALCHNLENHNVMHYKHASLLATVI